MTDDIRPDAPQTVDAPAAEAAADDRVAALEAEVAGLKDQLLRTLAEMENLRRRTEREVADTRSYAVAGFARDMLQVGDNLSRALQVLPADARDGASPAVIALLEGVEMTERELLKAFEKHGVRKIDPVGEKFDPNFHQAMFEVPNPEVPNGTVVQVVQSGFVIGERVLRPAMVGVGRGGPKAAPAAEATEPKVDRTV
ncbi:nucleotide exchange factor GrpE [Chthonobacter rhizosphaerae]|uniref:nucleotide exchange factor GrpE n=1 Tax=Chthonobacter rhizosphaerae TaxID=2735553 RepID=UPI0015EEFBF4|nr:nucleotide exchange factor GrpE [Chthonobacter rhizosphaerae]